MAASTSPPDSEVIAASASSPSEFDRHFDPIYAHLQRRVGPDLVEELAAETFLVAFAERPKTATLLAQGESVSNPDVADRDVPQGTPFRQSAYLESGVVDASGAVPGEG